MRFLCCWFRRGCLKPSPVYIPVPVASCTHGVVIQRGSQGEIDGVAALGAKVVRMTYFTANEVDPNYRRDFEGRLLALDAKGIETLLVVHDFPAWEAVAPKMADLVQSFPNRTWQLGNEYDAQPWRGWGNTGARYATLMRDVVTACPGQRFVGMGLASADGQGIPGVAPDITRQPQFLRDYLAANGTMLAAWCLHLYGTLATITAKANATSQVLAQRMPLWLTEYNQSTPPDISDATEVQIVSDVTANAARLGVSRTYFYDYWDGPGSRGLVRNDDTHRPAWDTFHSIITV